MLARYRIHLLLAVALCLAWLNWYSPPSVEVVNVTERSAASPPVVASTGLASNQPAQSPSGSPLPEQLSRPGLESARNDPFVLPPPPPVVVKLAPQPAPVAPPAPPPPMAPPLGLRYAGRMTTPEGQQVVYVALGDTSLTLAIGQNLPNGYRVDAITPSAVEFTYPPLNTTARLELPEPPRYEIR